MLRYIFKPKGGEQHFKGFIHIPQDGIYTFYYRAGGNGELLINGLTISPKNRYLGAPYPRVIKLKAKAGYLAIEFWASMTGSKYWSASSEISWEGPSFERKFMEFSDFVYSQKELKSIAEKVKINKLGQDDNERNEGIRNHYLGAFSGGGGKIYLNGKIIGELKAGQLWTQSTKLHKGDILMIKADAAGEGRLNGAGLAGLFKGKPLFGTEDCKLSPSMPENSSLVQENKASILGPAGQTIMAKEALKFFNSKLVWVQNAKSVSLIFEVE